MRRRAKGMFPVLFILQVILTLVALLSTVTGTVTYYAQEGRVENYLYSRNYQVDLIDLFDNNQMAMPGDTLGKQVSMKNNGETSAVIRVKLTPAWAPTTDTSGKTLNSAAIQLIWGDSFDTYWVKIGDYYYYKFILMPGQESSKLVQALKITAIANDAHAANYSEAIYTLGVLGQSLQALPQAAVDNWGMDYTIDTGGILTWKPTPGG